MPQALPVRYWAFISYSHRDEKKAAWLHRSLEGYRVHRQLVGQPNGRGEPVPARLFPVFRDREELAGSADLPSGLQAVLRASRSLIVVCSPAAARSPWVNEEVRLFKALGGEDRVLAVIVDGEPNATDTPGQAAQECFPQALRFRVDADGSIGQVRTEPIAADLRPGKDKPHDALLKLLAGLLDVRFDDLRRRDQERAARRRNWITAGSLATTALFGALALYAFQQQGVAEERSRVALSRQLAAQAANDTADLNASGRRTDHARALLLAIHALRIKPTAEARAALFKAVLASPQPMRYLWGHTAPMTAVAFSPDARRLASADESGGVIVWDTATAQLVCRLPRLHRGAVTSVAFHPGEPLLATGGVDTEVRLWDPATCQPRGQPLGGSGEPVRSVDFSPDGRLLAAGGGGNIVTLGRLMVWPVPAPDGPGPLIETPHGKPIASLAFSPDSRTLVTGSADGRLVVWDVATLTPRQTWEGHQVASLAFNRQGDTLVSGGASGRGTRSLVKQPFSLLLWDMATGSVSPLGASTAADRVRSVAFGPDGAVASTGPDGKVQVWDTRRDPPDRPPFIGHADTVVAMAFSRDGVLFASASADGHLMLRRLGSYGPLTRPFQPPPPAQERPRDPFLLTNVLGLSADARLMAAEELGGRVVVWDTRAGVPLRTLPPSGRRPIAIAMAPDGRTVVVTSHDGITLWDADSGNDLGNIAEVERSVKERAIDPASRLLAVMHLNHSIGLWDLRTGRSTGALVGHAAPLNDLAYSADGKTLASVDRKGELRVWDLLERRTTRALALGGDGALGHVRFSPDGGSLALVDGSRQGSRIVVVKLADGVARELPVPRSLEIQSTRYSADGRTLVGAARNGTLLVWDAASGPAEPSELIGHRDEVRAIGFSGDDSLLSSVDAKGQVIFWDLRSRAEIARTRVAREGNARAAVFSGGAETLLVDASDYRDRRFVAFRWALADLAAYACDAANRELSAAEWAQRVGSDVPRESGCPGVGQAPGATTASSAGR